MATITTSEARKISGLQKAEGRLALAECLHWEPFDEEKEMQKSIYIDFLYDNMMFAVDKGFSWDKVVAILELSAELLQEIRDCENITEILGFYRSKSVDLCTALGEREYKIFTDYVFSTVLAHFKLIKYVFTNARKEQIPHVNVLLNPPFDPSVLKQSKGLNIWQYEQTMSELEKREEQRANERLVEQGKKTAEVEAHMKQTLDSTVNTDKPIDRDSVQKIIEDVMKAYTLAATENMKANITQLQEDLDFKLQKTSLPRPQALGPPPRYSVPVIQKTSAGRTRSPPKPGSRASTRAKKK